MNLVRRDPHLPGWIWTGVLALLAAVVMSLCRKFVALNGGRIWVESDGEGLGSVFHFTLPSPSAGPDSGSEAPA